MYSRQFDQSPLPPDYSGTIRPSEPSVAEREFERCERCSDRQKDDCDISSRSPRSERYQTDEDDGYYDRTREGDFRKERARRPRRPVYEDTRTRKDENENRESDRGEEAKKGIGSLLSRMNFSLEDILIGALILLMLSGKGDEQKDADNELIVLLGFLLIIGL